MIKAIAAVTLGLAAALGGTPALADYVVYTTRANFEATLPNEQTENFDELGSKLQIVNPNGLSVGGGGPSQPITVSGASGFLLSASSSALAGYYPTYGTYLVGPTTMAPTDGITVSLPANTYSALGADVGGFASNTLVSFVATTSKGETLTGSVAVDGSTPGSTLGFLGVALATPNDYLTSLTFSTPLGANQNIVFDNLSFGGITPSAVPEPASMALMGMGTLVLAAEALRRRQRSKVF